MNAATLDEIAAILDHNADFLIGSEDREDMISDWAATGLSEDEIEAWTAAGCFIAADASALVGVGLTPKQCAGGIAYDVANGDATLGDALIRAGMYDPAVGLIGVP